MDKFPPDISIRNKIIIFLTLLFLIGGLCNYIFLQKIIFPSFVKLEVQEAVCQTTRVINAIKDTGCNVDTLCRKWSVWDDAYFFMEGLNTGFALSNLGNSTQKNADLNLVLFFDTQGKVVYVNEINLKTGRQIVEPGFPTKNIPAEMFDLLTDFTESSLEEAKVAGLFPVGEKIYIISCRPILTSDGEGPANGYLLMAKLFSASLKAELQKKIHADFTIYQGGDNLPGLLSARAYPIADKAIYLDPVNDDTLYGLTEIAGIDGHAALTVKIAVNREITRQGTKTIRTTIFAILVLGCLSLCLIIITYNLLVHRPLITLTRHAKKITYESDFSSRLDVEADYRNDEIGDLAREFNDMLDTLEFTYAQLDDINDQQNVEIIRRQKLEKKLLKTQKKLEELAALDGLTQIANRRFFNEEFSRQWLLHLRQQRPLALVLCDVDHFKLYNDTYGHPTGDSCLKKVAGVLKASARRPSDLTARYGGEEFIVLLPETPASGAVTVAEKIRISVEQCNIEHKASLVSSHLTLSLGVAGLVPQAKMRPEVLIDLADKALYRAKEQGRNRVVAEG
jgi:diguanylate cyclase (GGDEF)-like protein